MLDIDGRTNRRRRRARIRGVLGMLLCALIAASTATFTVIESSNLLRDQGRQNTYDKAPYCTTPTQVTNCVLRTTANVDYVDVWKNTGRHSSGHTTSVYLNPAVGEGQSVTLSKSKDLSNSVSFGDQFPVLVWHDQITRYTFQGKTHDSDQDPHHIVGVDLGLLAMVLLVMTAFGRPVIRRLQRNRIAINLKRNRIPDWILVILGLVTPFAALLHASDLVAVLNVTGVTVLVLSVAWPFVPWVATTSMAEPYLKRK